MDSQVGSRPRRAPAKRHGRNTIVILWSDHGWHLGEKLITGKKTRSGIERLASPLIFAGPGIAQGARCTQPVELWTFIRP